VGEEGRIKEKQRWLKAWKEKKSRPLPKSRPTNTTVAAASPRRKPSNQLHAHSFSVREEKRVREKHKWLKPWREWGCNRWLNRGRRKGKS
jgi:hypothetical protein